MVPEGRCLKRRKRESDTTESENEREVMTVDDYSRAVFVLAPRRILGGGDVGCVVENGSKEEQADKRVREAFQEWRHAQRSRLSVIIISLDLLCVQLGS